MFIILFSLFLAGIFVAIDADGQPLLFKVDPTDPHRVRILWNPDLNITRVLSVAQRDVNYDINAKGKVFTRTTEWQTIVRPQDGHTSSRRYAFVRQNTCQEIGFKLSYLDIASTNHFDIEQSMEALPRRMPIGVDLQLQSTYFDGKFVRAKINWEMNETMWHGIQQGPISPSIELVGCGSIFPADVEVEKPKLSQDMKTLIFDRLYADHWCRFKVRMGFAGYNASTNCLSAMESDDSESLLLDLNCVAAAGLPCRIDETAPCGMDCSPRISLEPAFSVENQIRKLKAKVKWHFSSTTNGEYYIVRSTPVYLYHNNQIFDAEPEVTQIVKGDSVDLELFSKTPEAIYAMQVCAVPKGKTCDLGDSQWYNIPMQAVSYHKILNAKFKPQSESTSNEATHYLEKDSNNKNMNGTDESTPEQEQPEPENSIPELVAAEETYSSKNPVETDVITASAPNPEPEATLIPEPEVTEGVFHGRLSTRHPKPEITQPEPEAPYQGKAPVFIQPSPKAEGLPNVQPPTTTANVKYATKLHTTPGIPLKPIKQDKPVVEPDFVVDEKDNRFKNYPTKKPTHNPPSYVRNYDWIAGGSIKRRWSRTTIGGALLLLFCVFIM